MKCCTFFFFFSLLFIPIGSAEELRIVALGDSTTAGTPGFRSPLEIKPYGAGNPKSQFGYWVMKRNPQWEVFNRGVEGERSDQIAKRFKRDVLKKNPDFVTILAGVNDLYQGYPAEHVIRHLKALYHESLRAGIPVIACTILPYNSVSQVVQERMAYVSDWISQTSLKNEHVYFCDTATAVRNPDRPGYLISSADGLHPDVEGYRKVGETVAHCIESAIEASGR